MATLKLESVSSTVFKVDGKSFLKGDYTVEITPSELFYLRPKNTTVGNSIVSQKAPWKTPQPYTAFIDSADTAYASADVFSLALANLVAGPTNSAVSDLISDKAQVTQGTSKTTTVVSDTLNTIITTVALTDAADAAFSFTFTNSKITATSNVLPTVNMNSGNGKAYVTVVPGSGSATVTVTNVGTASFNSAIKIGLVVV